MKFEKIYESIKENREDYKEWKKLVNMNPSELEKFMNSEDGKKAGLSRAEASKEGISSGRDSAKAIIRMKNKPFSNWNNTDLEWMKKQISFINRFLGMKGKYRDENNQSTRKLLALKIWGHDPEK